MMFASLENDLENNIALYALLSSVFLTLPDEQFVNSVLAEIDECDTDSEGFNEIARYAREQAGRDRTEVLLDVARDRVRLIRGVNNEGIRPPYESLYVGYPANETVGSLNSFYAEVGYQTASDIKDTSDQIGVEFAFMKLVLEKELEAHRTGNEEEANRLSAILESFRGQHIGRWVHAYAKEMEKAASTGFYRGMARLILEAA